MYFFTFESKEDVPRVLILGFFSFCNVVGFVVALSLTSATNCAAAQPTIPVFACLLAVVSRQERLTPLKALGILVCAGGAIAVAITASEADSKSRSDEDVVWGNVVLFFQCCFMGALLVFQKALDYPAPLVSLYYYSCGTVLTLFMSIYYAIYDQPAWYVGGESFWGALAYTAVLSTAYNFVVYAYAVKILSGTLTSLYSALQPVSTLVLSLIFLGTGVNAYEIVAGIFVIAGLILTTYARMREQAAVEPLLPPEQPPPQTDETEA